MKTGRRRGWWIIASCLVVATAAAAISAAATKKKEESKYYPLTIFSKVLAHIQAAYVEEVNIDKLIYGAIRGMVSSLDPHSSYLTPDEYKTVQEEVEGKFGGVGIEVDFRFGRLVVISSLPGTPSERSGIRSGDEILSIDGFPVYLLTMQEAVRKMRGEPGTKVTLKLRRGEQEIIEVELTREMISIESVEGEILDEEGKTALLVFKVFQEGTAVKARKLLDEFAAKRKGGLRGLIIDLRGNPGGLLDEAIYVADEFLEKGVIVTMKRRSGEVLETEKAHRVGTRSNFEIVVVVNEYTASAAEVLAGALQDNGRARVVGMRTFGKGSIQNIIRLPDRSALKLTTALYATPSGKIIQGEGIEPDLIVPQIEWSAREAFDGAFSERDIRGHIKGWEEAGKSGEVDKKGEGERGGSAVETAPAKEGRTLPPRLTGDYQLFMAYQYLLSRLKEKGDAP